MGGNYLSAGVGWPQQLWGANQGGLLNTTGGPPVMTFGGNIPYTAIGQNWPRFGYLVNNRWQFSDDLTWSRAGTRSRPGSSTATTISRSGAGAGGTGQFNFNRLGTAGFDGRGTISTPPAIPLRRSSSGRCRISTQTIPVYPTFNEAYTAAWINDEFKVNDRLTLTLDCATTISPPGRKHRIRYSTFDPNTPNPGAGGLPGALIFAGEGTGRAGHAEVRAPEEGCLGSAGGLCLSTWREAGDPRRLRDLLRGVALDQFIGLPTLGFSANSLAPEHEQRHLSGVLPGQGIPGRPGRAAAVHQPGLCQRHQLLAVPPDGLTLPRFQNWS